MASLGDFASELIAALGGRDNPQSQRFFNSWQRWEGGMTANAATWNPLNLTAPGSGLPTINSVGVVAIPTEQQGVQRTAALLKSGYPALATALATGQVNFSSPQVQGDLNRWLSGKRTPGMTPYVSKIAAAFGQGGAASAPASAVSGTPAATRQPLTASPPSLAPRPYLDLPALGKAIGQGFITGKGRIDIMGLPQMTQNAWVTPSPAPASLTPSLPAAQGAQGGTVIEKGAKFGSPTLSGKRGGEHPTMGLEGYPAYDYFAPSGAPAVAPVSGTVIRLSGHDPAQGPVQGPHGPLGWSVYIQGDDGHTYYLTHMGSRDVQVGSTVRQGQLIGTVADYAKYGTPSHIHMGVH